MKEIRNRIELAKINQLRSKQINEKQTRRVQELVKDAEVDEFILSKLEEEKNKEKEKEIKKKNGEFTIEIYASKANAR